MSEQYANQVRLLLRVLPLVAQEEVFALKGGTAINLFERDLPRLSVDIDLTYLPFDNRQTALSAITDALKRLKSKIEAIMRDVKVTLVTQSDGTEAKLHCQSQAAQIKIEVNTVMRGHILPQRLMSCTPRVQDTFRAFVEINVISQGELYGGKICAALDRQHPRDLFDVKLLLENDGITDAIKLGMLAALISHPRPINEVLFPQFRDQRAVFDSQFDGMALLPFSYEDYVATRLRLKSAIAEVLTPQDREFLVSFKSGQPDWSLVGEPSLAFMPAIQWKLMNIRKLQADNPSKRATMLAALIKKREV
jgi:predicted nucleotidyltransferase component of viral defense system